MSSSERPLRTGVIGAGALGRHHVRLLSTMPESTLVGLVDANPETAKSVAEEFGTRVFSSVGELGAEVEAMVVAAPTVEHCNIGCALLESGVHVMVEKPIAATLAEADRLLEAQGDLVLAVGHVEFYNPAVQALLEAAGTARFVDIDRLSVFTRRSLDIDVVLDLMIHDLQILHTLDPSDVVDVRATGINVLSQKIDMADARIELASGCVANITASRVSSERVRQLRAFFEDRYYSLDYQNQTVKGARLTGGADVPEKTIELQQFEIERDEPLRVELAHFLDRCRGGGAPLVDGAAGRRALRTAFEVVHQISGT